ncbi:hypothetical protein Tco_0923424 [Tanacetum coccineum]|uniref:Uncharacterized protein n=1 Tax=Tanacetum coccineum TaxID=301880 RepID=A0ABQ5D0X7_9ASTR
MHTGSRWIRGSSELTRKNLVILASVICYPLSILIKCTSLGEHLLLSSIEFMFQAENREISSACKEHMPYPRFTKVIINDFISKDKTISMRNMMNLHTVRDDTLLGTLKFVSKTQDYQQYGALIPNEMINQDIKDSKAYKTHLDFATRKATPKKARKFKKVASPSRKLSPVLEEEPAEKPKLAKKPAKKSTTVPTAGVVIKDTPSESMPKNKTPAKVVRGKGMNLLSDVASLKAAQLKKTLKKSKLETHKLHASGSGDGVGSQPKVPDEQEDKPTSTDEGTGTKPGVPDVPNNDDDNDEVTKDDDDDDDVNSDADGDNEASDSEKTDSDKVENPNLNQNDDEEDEYEEEYVRTPDSVEFIDDDEEYEELYKDVNIRLQATEHEEEGKRDEEMTDDGTQQTTYEQVKDDEHVILTTVHDAQKTEVPLQSSSVSSDFANQFLTLDNVPPTNTEVVSMMNVKINHSSDNSTKHSSSTTINTNTNSCTNNSDYSAQLLETIKSQIPAMVDAQLSTRLEDSIKKSFRSYTAEFEKKAKDERKRYIDLVENFITKSLKNIVLAKSSSQPKSKNKAAASLTEFELKKILLGKIQKSKSYRCAQEHKYLYDALVKSYKLDKDLFESYSNVYSLKRDREDKHKDEDPPAGSDQGLKKQKTRKDAEPSRGSKSKESKSSSSKGTNKIAKAGKPPLTFDELMSTPIDFSAYVLNNLKIKNLTQEYLIGPAFNLFKGTCKRRVELKYHFEECYKAFTDRLDWTNPEGHEYPFDLSKPLPLIKDQGRQVANYFFNNDLAYLKEDMVSLLWSPVKKMLSNLERDVIYDLNVALQMFTIHVFILKRVEDLQLGVKSYQKKLNITKPETFRVLHDIASSLEMDYLPKRRWSKLDRKSSRIMIKAIDHQLFEKRLMRNLEKFVGGREYREDFRLLERTI